jgi:uncharacterized membrane protein YedE/YeeE
MILIDQPFILMHGLAIGIVFGFLLHRGSVSRFETIVGQFLFTNFTVLKIMLTAIIVGGLGVYGLRELGLISELPLPASSLWGSALGGMIFGCGMAILGYCPGTAIAALAEGARDVLYGILGMFVGTAIFETVYPWFYSAILSKDATKETLATFFEVSPWFILGILVACAIIMFKVIDRYMLHNK